jgi:hypothetical protein
MTPLTTREFLTPTRPSETDGVKNDERRDATSGRTRRTKNYFAFARSSKAQEGDDPNNEVLAVCFQTAIKIVDTVLNSSLTRLGFEWHHPGEAAIKKLNNH